MGDYLVVWLGLFGEVGEAFGAEEVLELGGGE
jgi:hypothetical protein